MKLKNPQLKSIAIFLLALSACQRVDSGPAGHGSSGTNPEGPGTNWDEGLEKQDRMCLREDLNHALENCGFSNEISLNLTLLRLFKGSSMFPELLLQSKGAGPLAGLSHAERSCLSNHLCKELFP